MGISVDWVGYGRAAAQALRDQIAAIKGDEPLSPVTVIVPSNHVGVATRRLLASGAVGAISERGVGMAAVSFVTVYRLAELLGAPALATSGRRPVSTPVIASALRHGPAANAGVFEPVAAHPATETALVAAYRELRDASEPALDALAGRGPRAADIVRLHRAARAWLEPAWYDEEDLMVSAAADLHGTSDLGAVVVYLPQRLSRHAMSLISELAGVTTVHVLAGATGDVRADDEVLRTTTGLGADRLMLAPEATVVGRGRTRFVTTSDADDEVRGAVRAVVDAACAGTALDRIAVLHPGHEPYARLLHEHLAQAGIHINGASAVPLTARVVGRMLLGLLDLPTGGFRRDDVFSWLMSAPLLHDRRLAPVAAWERISREAGVVAGRAEWSDRLQRLAAASDDEAAHAEADPESPPWRAERARAEAERARSLRQFVLGLIDDLDVTASAPRRWAQHATWARHQLDRLLGEAQRRSAWPLDERNAVERAERAIDRLGALDDVEGAVTLELFTRTLRLELESDLGRVGRFGDGVFVGPISMGVGLDLDLVVIVGLVEGSLPATIHDDSLLPDHERAAAKGELVLRAETVDRQHRWLLAALAGGAHQLLCLPRGDLRRSTERVPSRWSLDLVSLVGAETGAVDVADRPAALELFGPDGGATVGHVASFDAGLRQLAFPATAQEHRLRTIMAAGGAAPPDAVVDRGVDMIRARRGSGFTRFDGNLAGSALVSPAVTSASRLERWVNCPFSYFMADVLGVDEVDNPEDQVQISPLDRGELVHAILERFILEVLQRPALEQIAPDEPWSADDHARMRAAVDELCADYEARGLTGRSIFWRHERRRIEREMTRVLADDSQYRAQHGTRPFAAELAFGIRDARLPPVPFDLPDGRVVSFRGKADRVDVADDGTLHVVDYKTGKNDAYAKLSEATPDLGGHKLQLPIYAQAARLHRGEPTAAVVAQYWFVSARGGFGRAGYLVTDDVLEQVGGRLQVIIDGIDQGVFPNHPTGSSTSVRVDCAYCDPDGLGVTDLSRQWERKRDDPAMAGYTGLVEPDD